MAKHKNFVPRETFSPKNLDLSEKCFNFAPKLKTYGSKRNIKHYIKRRFSYCRLCRVVLLYEQTKRKAQTGNRQTK